MKIGYQDLLGFLSEKPSKDLLSDKLFQLGHEHEIDHNIFDMELTPNRGDCLSLLGLARDLNIFFGLNDVPEIYNEKIEVLDLNFKNFSKQDCPKISFLEIEIEGEVSKYRSYLEDYFLVSGNNKTNFFTDISNYISYELGQPTHCFDRSKVSKELSFENKDCNEDFITLLDTKIKLKGLNCVFCHEDEIISLAGVMGGKSSACSRDTKKVLVECAYFNPESIIGKSLQYNLNSDAAHKFERGVDISSQEVVLRRFIKIVQDHASIKSLKLKEFKEHDYGNTLLPIDVGKINNILGTQLEEIKYIEYLKKLGFNVEEQIEVPSYRHDISSQNDLAEEIARVIGYDNIDSTPLNLKIMHSQKIKNTDVIRNHLVENGFTEVINFPFNEEFDEKRSISIDNPLDSSRKYLRTSLKESLIENLLYNERRQKESIKIFEVSNVYHNEMQLQEEIRLGIIISGRVDENYIDYSKSLDASFIEESINNLGFETKFLIEEINRQHLKTKKKNRIFYTEILIKETPKKSLLNQNYENKFINFKKYEEISSFPSSKRDFSFSITNLEKYDQVIEIINNFKDKNLKRFFIFDFFKNKKSLEVKLGVSLIFQSSSKTLSEEEIQQSISNLLKPIIQIDGVSIPGLEL